MFVSADIRKLDKRYSEAYAAVLESEMAMKIAADRASEIGKMAAVRVEKMKGTADEEKSFDSQCASEIMGAVGILSRSCSEQQEKLDAFYRNYAEWKQVVWNLLEGDSMDNIIGIMSDAERQIRSAEDIAACFMSAAEKSKEELSKLEDRFRT